MNDEQEEKVEKRTGKNDGSHVGPPYLSHKYYCRTREHYVPPGILIVDDEFSVRDSLDHWFRKDGYEVRTAADAAEATAAMQAGAFDVVLLDVRLPGMDGMRLLEQIRRTAPADDRRS